MRQAGISRAWLTREGSGRDVADVPGEGTFREDAACSERSSVRRTTESCAQFQGSRIQRSWCDGDTVAAGLVILEVRWNPLPCPEFSCPVRMHSGQQLGCGDWGQSPRGFTGMRLGQLLLKAKGDEPGEASEEAGFKFSL